MKFKMISAPKIDYPDKWKIFIDNPFPNCNRIYPIQQKKVKRIIELLQNNPNVMKIVIFGSSVTNKCHIDSDVDVYVELTNDCRISLAQCDFLYDLWTNFTVDERLKNEILKKKGWLYMSEMMYSD